MLTPEQLRALVMASLAGPRLDHFSCPLNQWSDSKRVEYLVGLSADADLIIAAAQTPATRQALAFETDADGARGVMVSPPVHRHRLDQPAAPAV